MSAQRARSAVAADHRSAHPNIPGLPWWGAVLTAITLTAIGFAFDAGAGSKELGTVFAACYVIGCLAAVLVVRQAALFTAVIQPPLILFVAVPTAYFLFTSGQSTGLRDILINCGYPLIERFPLMFFTSAAVLLVGMFLWYHGMSNRRGVSRSADESESGTGVASALTAKMSALFNRDPDDDVADEKVVERPRRRRPAESRTRSTATRGERERTTRSERERGTRRSAPSRSRHVRPPETEIIEPVAERPRRTRSRQEPPSSAEPRSNGEPRRRPRPPRQAGPPPSERRSSYDRAERRRRFDDYDIQPREPHGRNGSRNGNGTHHPISRVRYRGEETEDRAEYRTRRRTTREREADSWEYDV